jgi:hypothetical protein
MPVSARRFWVMGTLCKAAIPVIWLLHQTLVFVASTACVLIDMRLLRTKSD